MDKTLSSVFTFQVISLQLPEGKQVFATHGENVLTSQDGADTRALAPCNHEEADSRMMIHALDASLHGHRRIKIRSNDTDVVILAVSIAPTLPLDELWISFGSSMQAGPLSSSAHHSYIPGSRESRCLTDVSRTNRV